MDATTIIAIIPVILIVGYIIYIAKQGLGEEHNIDMGRAVMSLAVLLVGILIISSLTTSVTPYHFDEENKTLYVNQNVVGDRQPWDSYSDDVKSLFIGGQCKEVSSGAFDSLTNLEFISISYGANIASGAFGVTFKDAFDEDMDPEPGRYVGGSGTLYQEGPGMLTYSANHAITGLTADYTAAKILVIPARSDGGSYLASIGQSAFSGSGLVKVLHDPDCKIEMIDHSAFNGCAGLTSVMLPESVTSITYRAFYRCTALTDCVATGATVYGSGAFQGCTALDMQISPNIVSISGSVFNGCAGLTEVFFPASVQLIDSYSFNGCTGVTKVSFADGYSPSDLNSQAFRAWAFYGTDGTTQIDKYDITATAGKTFEGTALSLIEVAPGQLSLTPDQLQMVQLHMQ